MFYFSALRLCSWVVLGLSAPCWSRSPLQEGLCLNSYLCVSVSCTVICGCVLGGHRVQLQEELVLGCFCSDWNGNLHGWIVCSFSTVGYIPHPLQVLPLRLSNPNPVVTTGDGETSDRAGEEERLWGLHQARSCLPKLHLGQDFFKQESQFC